MFAMSILYHLLIREQASLDQIKLCYGLYTKLGSAPVVTTTSKNSAPLMNLFSDNTITVLISLCGHLLLAMEIVTVGARGGARITLKGKRANDMSIRV